MMHAEQAILESTLLVEASCWPTDIAVQSGAELLTRLPSEPANAAQAHATKRGTGLSPAARLRQLLSQGSTRG
eukprot:1478004-Amphidinium_carterae.1